MCELEREMEISGNGRSWSQDTSQLAMVNTLDQWVEEFTRHREEEPSILCVHKNPVFLLNTQAQ